MKSIKFSIPRKSEQQRLSVYQCERAFRELSYHLENIFEIDFNPYAPKISYSISSDELIVLIFNFCLDQLAGRMEEYYIFKVFNCKFNIDITFEFEIRRRGA